MNVFLIDDDAALARSLEIILTVKGWHVYAFANAIDVCWFIENGAYPDVLIVDQVMPDFTGIEVIDRVRAFLPRWCRVILISGHTELVDKLDLKNHGISAFLPKPIDLDKLSSLVADTHMTTQHNP